MLQLENPETQTERPNLSSYIVVFTETKKRNWVKKVIW